MATLDSIKQELRSLRLDFESAFTQIDGQSLIIKSEALKAQMESQDFWVNSSNAAEISKQSAKLESRLQPWLEVKRLLEEAEELISIADEAMLEEVAGQVSRLELAFTELKNQLKLSGPYDDYDAYLSIHAGAGGTDAQDWAEMLERMYLRWAEANRVKAEIIDRNSGEEAGVKSVSMLLSGEFVYGKLRGEHGVHRLVRLSPFNADALRQTSFAKVEVVPKVDSPEEVNINEKDLKIDVFRSGGKGGQSVNTTDSAVRVTHIPTNIVVAIQNERSQLQNKEMAMAILRSKLAQLRLEQHAQEISDLKGPNEQAAWGNQIRNYVLHPYKMVKDLRTNYETSDTEAVLDGQLNEFINAYLEFTLGN